MFCNAARVLKSCKRNIMCIEMLHVFQIVESIHETQVLCRIIYNNDALYRAELLLTL